MSAQGDRGGAGGRGKTNAVVLVGLLAAGVLVWVAFSPFRATTRTSLGGPGVLRVPPRGAVSPEFCFASPQTPSSEAREYQPNLEMPPPK